MTLPDLLPRDPDALLVGRVWSNAQGGPCPVLVGGGQVRDLSGLSPTFAGLLELPDLPARCWRHATCRRSRRPA